MEKGGGDKVILLNKKLLGIDTCQEKRVGFFNKVAPGRLISLQWKSTYLRVYKQDKLNLDFQF